MYSYFIDRTHCSLMRNLDELLELVGFTILLGCAVPLFLDKVVGHDVHKIEKFVGAKFTKGDDSAGLYNTKAEVEIPRLSAE